MPKPPGAAEIAPLELARLMESGEPIQILDVRAPARLASGRIDVGPEQRFFNIVGSRLATLESTDAVGLDPQLPVAVVCGHGNSSRPAALHLRRLGYDARSVTGGLAAWMGLVIPRALDVPPSLDHLIQFDRVGKGSLGYLLVSDGTALILDPPRLVDAYLETVAQLGARVVAVTDTHVHADYISGGPDLAQRLGVPYYLHPADTVYPYDGRPGTVTFDPVRDGAVIAIGRCRVRAVHTPGHTEGSVTYVVDDAAAFTGDFLFVNSIGRPDLAGKTSEWSRQLYHSLHRARTAWPPALIIYPGHYASPAERRPDRSVAARFGELLATNDALRLADETAFVAWVAARVGEFPQTYRTIKAVNVGLRTVDEFEAEELEGGKHQCALP